MSETQKPSIYVSTIGKVLSWARSQSLWYISTGSGCCADEALNAVGCRYDMERFGCLPQVDARQADLLIVSGVVSYKAATQLRATYESMLSPKYVLAVGSCANCGGPFSSESSYSVVPGVDQILPVDVYVPGCPPRPEAIMNGLIALQEKSVDTGEILNKLKAAAPGSVLEKSRFGRSAHLSLWVETRSLPEIAAYLKNDPEIALDWLENLSAIQMDKALVLTYFLRSTRNANTLILRGSLEPSSPSKEVKLGSVAAHWTMAGPFEAEIQEMFGVRFSDVEGEPAYTGPGRLPHDWTGFPLRKTYVFPTEFLGIPHARKPVAPESEAP